MIGQVLRSSDAIGNDVYSQVIVNALLLIDVILNGVSRPKNGKFVSRKAVIL